MNLLKYLLLISFFMSPLIGNAQCPWVNFADETSSRLVLSTTFQSDAEEKDLSVADFNKDGWDDVIIVRKNPFSSAGSRADLLLINDNGVLKDSTNFYAPEFISFPTDARDVLVMDLDGDTWTDVVVCNTFAEQPVYYKNLGNDSLGNWLGLDRDTTKLPTLTINPIQFCAIWGGDVNGDTYPDLYFSNYNPSGGCEDILLINDGNGNFTDETVARLGNLRFSAFGTSAEIHDMDNDGDNDIIKISTLYSVAPWNDNGVFLLFNDGTGNFSNWQQTNAASPYMFSVADFNADNMKDMYVVDDNQDRLNIANTLYPDSLVDFNLTILSNSPRTTGFGGNIKFTDIDNDGDTDIGVASVDVDIPPCVNSRTFALLENTGLNSANFQDPLGAVTNIWNINNYDFVFIDIDNDGNDDMLHGACTGYKIFRQIPPVQFDTIIFNHVSCNGASDGSISPVVTGGVPPYSYLWSNGATGSSVSGLTTGGYSCTVTTSNGCTVSATGFIIEPTELSVTSGKQNVSCHGVANGKAFVSVSGGTAPYTYSWNTTPVQTTSLIENLDGGFYTCTITDANGCTKSVTTEVRDPALLQVFVLHVTQPTTGNSNGAINIGVTGGIAPYTHLWNTAATTEDLNNIPAGVYNTTAIDRRGCAVLQIVTLTNQ